MAKEKVPFLDGAKRLGFDLKKAEGVFDLMAKFAEYGFNKSHSAAYALIAYQTAYLKTHYPVEFMAALLTEDMDKTEKVIKNIAEVRSMGIEVLPPDINASAHSFTVHDRSIRFGLGAVKGVGAAALDAITESRQQDGPFLSLPNFCERVDLRRVNKKVAEALIKCGAFDSAGGRRAQFIAILEEAMEGGQKAQREKANGQESLFGTAEIRTQNGSSWGELPDIEEWPENILLSFEKEALGFYITGHPLARHSAAIKRFATCETAALPERADKEEVKICGIVAASRELTTKKGERMAFVTLEDLTGFVEVILFPEVYQSCSELIKSDEPLLVSGVINVEEESCKLMASEVLTLKEVQERLTRRVHLRLSSPGLDQEQLQGLKDLLQRHRGGCDVRIHLVVPNRSETVINLPPGYQVAATDQLMSDTDKLFGYHVVSFE